MHSNFSSDLQAIAHNVIGRNELVSTPFGERALCYADFTASARSLHCVEDFIRREVLPLYGNTHTTTSITGSQTTRFREEARRIIADSVNTNSFGEGNEYAVIFTGSGTTSAVIKIVTALGLHVPLPAGTDASQRPVVFVGPFEHHSNLLPWRESIAEVVMIPENERGQVDVDVLKQKLQHYASRPLKIGAFSAASNLTGVLTDVDLITATLHMHGALAFWDYASCAPYVAIDMNPVVANESLRPFVYKDAVYFSGHKFIGGPGSPGVLVVKKPLLGNAVPTTPGGGTVFFVTERDHRYLSNREEREEGGTPDILGSIRLGLAFEIKQRIGAQHIMELERKHVARVRSTLATNDKIVLLGRHDDAELDQLPIFSFLIRCGDRFLHYNFVCALLNDLFGIQTRGGCQCAGPYATRLLGLSKQELFHIERRLLKDVEVLRPGSSRVSFPYFMDDNELDFILDAIQFVADHGWKFLPQYTFDPTSGLWTFFSTASPRQHDPRRLSSFSLTRPLDITSREPQPHVDVQHHRKQTMATARALAATATVTSTSPPLSLALDLSCEPLRWFVYPSEAAAALEAGTSPVFTPVPFGPFQPRRYVDGTLLRQWETHTSLDNHDRERSGMYPLRRPDDELRPADVSKNERLDEKPRIARDLSMESRWTRIRAAFRRHLLRRRPIMQPPSSLTATATAKDPHDQELLLMRSIGAHVA